MINLIMPMAGAGSRFRKAGINLPKPLVQLNDRPLFVWATEAITKQVKEEVNIIYTVLSEHVEQYQIDQIIRFFFPDACINILQEITPGSLDSALSANRFVNSKEPIIINDCDHYFLTSNLDKFIQEMRHGLMDGFLCNFQSTSDSYSYCSYDENGYLIQTVEKKVISNEAIAGAYAFSSIELLLQSAEQYKGSCPYTETFVSGVYNTMVDNGYKIKGLKLDEHISFGTPEELIVAQSRLRVKE